MGKHLNKPEIFSLPISLPPSGTLSSTCMTVYDYAWLWMTMYDYVLLCMAMHDYVWLYMTKYDYVWQCMTMYV